MIFMKTINKKKALKFKEYIRRRYMSMFIKELVNLTKNFYVRTNKS